MSDEYHVHGPHDHAVEHAGAHGGGGDTLAGRIAVMTAVLATAGALFSYQGGNAENLALYYKNEAAIHKTEAANQWAYYQAKGEKQNLAQLGAALTTRGGRDAAAAHAKFTADAARYQTDKEPIRKQAEAFEAQVTVADATSERLLHRHHRWAQATMLVQMAISLAAITLLTRRRWLQMGAYGVAAAGVVVGGMALLGV